jgi:flavin-dependent dehydrogenase
MIPTPSASSADVVHTTWDVIVIGAGPAGALAARQAALAGLRTLLLEARPFPREKVCGGCLNRRAIKVLQRIGLIHVLDSCAAIPIRGIRVRAGRQAVKLPLPTGLAICRRALDNQLAREAALAGAVFMPATKAEIDPRCDPHARWLSVTRHGRSAQFSARIVVCADGLSRSSVKRLPECATRAIPASRIGIGAAFDGDIGGCPPELITMVVAGHGYVGLARCAERWNVAAALDAKILSGAAIGHVVADILASAGVSAPDGLSSAIWHGTPPLTSEPLNVAAERIFLIGDAGGYVEPFTGEGMAAAFESAIAVSPLVVEAATQWHPTLSTRWRALHRRLVRNRQTTCRQLAWVLRRPWALATTMSLSRACPSLAERVIARIN